MRRRCLAQIAGRDSRPAVAKQPVKPASAKAAAAPAPAAAASAPAAAASATVPAAGSATACKKRRSGVKQPWHNNKKASRRARNSRLGGARGARAACNASPPPRRAQASAPLRVGERVRAKYLASAHAKQRTTNYYWYNGVVAAIHADGSIDVTYDDADDEKGIKVRRWEQGRHAQQIRHAR